MTLLKDSKTSYLTFTIGTPVGLPDAGYVWLWRKNDGLFYVRDSSGVDSQISGDIGDLFTAKGDILVGTGAGAYDQLPIGPDGYLPYADSGETTGILWGPATQLSSAREFSFMPEFPGAVLHADGGYNVGTMLWDDDSTQRMNCYVWYATELDTQDYDVVLRFVIPPEFSAIGSAVKVWSKVSDAGGSTGVRLEEFLDTAGSNVIAAATKKNASWTEDSFTITGGTWTVGGIVTLRFRLFADTNDYAYLGKVSVPWTAE